MESEVKYCNCKFEVMIDNTTSWWNYRLDKAVQTCTVKRRHDLQFNDANLVWILMQEATQPGKNILYNVYEYLLFGDSYIVNAPYSDTLFYCEGSLGRDGVD